MDNIASTVEGSERDALETLLRNALNLADQMDLAEVAIYIDTALIALTGSGTEPPISA